MNELSIQELRQSLRERGANSRGSKKQLMQRLSEDYGFQAASSESASAVPKVRVTVQKTRQQCAMVLLDPTATPEANVHSILTKAANKWQYRPKHLFVVAAPTAAGGTEITSDNLKDFLKDGLVVLASSMSKLNPNALQTSSPAPAGGRSSGSGDEAAAMPGSEPTAESSRVERATDSGSCSSAEMDEVAERASLKSFDSDSLYSAHSTAHHSANPAGGLDENKEEGSAHDHPPKRRNWRSMLPQMPDQLEAAHQVHLPPPMPASVPLVRPTPSFQPSVPHIHTKHQCAPHTSGSSSASSSSSLPPRVPSIMEQIDPSLVVVCPCCDVGCSVDLPQLQLQPPPPPPPATPVAASQPAASVQLVRSHSTPGPTTATGSPPAASSSSSSAAPGGSPALSHSHHLRLLELERINRRLDASLKSYLKSDGELRARVASLSAGAELLPSLAEEFKLLKLSGDQKDKEIAKVTWERDRLKAKNAVLMTKNNELKAEAEALVALQKEHSSLQQLHARMSGHHVNAQTSPAVLQDLLLQHTNAIQRVHQQMSQNIQREKKELTEARQCKVCMSRPSDTILLPCSHFVLCAVCASSIKVCPICRSQVHDKRPVYT